MGLARAVPVRVRAYAAALGGAMIITLLPTEILAAQCNKGSGGLALGRTTKQSRTLWLSQNRNGLRMALPPNGAKGLALPSGPGKAEPCVVDPQQEEPPAEALAEEGRGSGVKGGGNEGDGGDNGHHQGGGNSGQ